MNYDPAPKRELVDDFGHAHTYVIRIPTARDALFGVGPKVLGLIGDTIDLRRGVGSALTGLADSVTRHGGWELLSELLRGVTRDGVDVSEVAGFEAAYTGNLGEVLRAVEAVLEVKFGGFSKAARATVGAWLRDSLRQLNGASPTSLIAILASGGASGASSTPGSPPDSSSASTSGT